MGLCPKSEIQLLDNYFEVIDTYKLNTKGLSIPDTLVDEDHVKKNYKWNDERKDAVVFDIGDFDGDGAIDILTGFGTFSTPFSPNPSNYSVVKILTYNDKTDSLQEFHPELGLDSFVVEGPIKKARFEDANNDGQLDIVILADLPYFLTLQKK